MSTRRITATVTWYAMPGDWGRAYTLTGYRIGPNGSLEFFTIGRFTNEQDVQ